MQTEKFVQGNTHEGLRCIVTNPYNGEPEDLSGCTLKFYAYTSAGAFAWGTNCQPLEGDDNNEIVYIPAATDFDTVGTFLGEFHITFPDTTVKRIHGFKLLVEAKSPIS